MIKWRWRTGEKIWREKVEGEEKGVPSGHLYHTQPEKVRP